MKKMILCLVISFFTVFFSRVVAQGSSGLELSLDGENDYMMVPHHTSLNFSSSFTVELWIKPLRLNRWQRLIGKGTTQDSAVSNWSISIMSDNTIDFFWESPQDQDHLITSMDIINDFEFHHIAAVMDAASNEFRLYIDGNLSHAKSTGGDLPGINNMPLYVGVRQVGENLEKGFKGEMDEIRIWNVARTSTQIQSKLYSTLGPMYYQSADSGLVGYWRCDAIENFAVNDNNLDDIRDFSSMGNHSDLTGNANLVFGNTPVGIEDRGPANMDGFWLAQNYPNPFNPSTTIAYQLVKSTNVTLSIYSVSGEIVRQLLAETQPAGFHEVKWDGKNNAGQAVPSGIYFYHIKSREFSQTRRMILIK